MLIARDAIVRMNLGVEDLGRDNLLLPLFVRRTEIDGARLLEVHLTLVLDLQHLINVLLRPLSLDPAPLNDLAEDATVPQCPSRDRLHLFERRRASGGFDHPRGRRGVRHLRMALGLSVEAQDGNGALRSMRRRRRDGRVTCGLRDAGR